MRTIKILPVLIFFIIVSIDLYLSMHISKTIHNFLFLHTRYALSSIILASIFFISFILLSYRICLSIWPIPVGGLKIDSPGEFGWSVYMMFQLMFFEPLLRSCLLPVPLTPIMYRMLGAKVGKGTFFSGFVTDPHLLTIGDNVIVGANSLIVSHVLEGELLAHFPISIGNNVTIGMRSSILPGVIIEDNAIVGAHSLVTKGTHIKSGEVWVGVPAKKIK